MQKNQHIQIFSNNSIDNKNNVSMNEESNKHLSTVEQLCLPKEIKEYKITSYPDNCEEFSRINKIIPLRKNKCKFAILIILDIITVFIINLFIAWFPQLNLYLIYDIVPLNEATNIGVYGKDNKLVIEELKNIELPKIDYESSTSVIKHFNMNLSSFTKILFFQFRLYDYIFNYEKKEFEGLKYFIQTQQDNFLKLFTHGLTETESQFQREIYGICDIDIKVHSVFRILLDELTDPFYLFQLYSVILWYCNEYEYYATVIVVLTIISLVVSVYDTHKNLKQLHNMSKYSCDVNVYRKNNNNEVVITKINSENLVPGDLYEIPEDGLAMPADTILVNGTVIINESMLTGESTPIVKVHMPSVDTLFDTQINDSEKYILFAGTKIVQKRSLQNKVLGVVYQTGFKTVKGNLIRAILFPKEGDQKFKTDSTKYIIFMGCLCLVGFAISLKFLIDNAGLTTKDIILKFLDLITTTVPPSLPACISVGITYSLSRLKDKEIFCIARERVNVLGKVNIICFDKTGTLTEDHLDISGYVPVKLSKNGFKFDVYKSSSQEYSLCVYDHYKNKMLKKNYFDKNKDLRQLFVECLATCHCITVVKEKLIGDPIDVKMFEGVGWQLKENSKSSNDNNNSNSNSDSGNNENDDYDPLIQCFVRPKEEQDLKTKLHKSENNGNEDEVMKSHYEIGIVRRFDFSSKLQRMTTITKNINEKYFKAFCKGSPEKVKELCREDTIPKNFNDTLSSYTSKGYRVLAMATKSIKMDFQQSQQVSRDFVESNMIFLGLLIVQNKLKDATIKTIEELDNADIRMVMATGDNILTAISVSKECKLIKGDSIVYSCEIEKDNEGNDNLIWNKVENYDDLNLKKKLTEEEFLNLKINNQNSKSINTNLNDSFNKSNNISNFSSKYPAEDVKLTTKLKQNEDFNDSINGESNIIKEENKQSQKKENNSMETEISAVNINDEISPSKTLGDNYVIALTGPTFEKLSKLNERYLKTKDPSLKNSHNTFRQILKNGIIFARMAPEHKALLVESFRKETFTVLMCGDGANDCAALRSADVGVSLSPEEASIAAHFTSKIPDISCLVKLLREGKCSLTTSIQTFKYMMLYSLIQFIAVSLLMIFQSYLTDFQFLASDLFIIFPLALFIAKTAPYEKLTFHYPQASLLSFPVICSILIQTIICFAFQFGGREVLKETNDWYVNTCETEGDEVFACEDNSVFFLISHYQYLTTALAFSVSKPFRKAIYTNWLLMIYLILVFFYSIWITINCDSWSKNLFGLYTFPKKNFKYYLFIVICVNFVISIFCEWVIMGFVRTCWEGVEIRRYRNEVKKSENDPDYEYNLCHYHRIYYYDRREKMKEDSENKNNNLDNNVNLNNENQVVAEQKQMENGSNEINEN